MAKRKSTTIGENLRRLRKNAGLSQLDIEKRTQIAQPNYSAIENDRRLPTLLQVVVLADCLACTTDEILGRLASHRR